MAGDADRSGWAALLVGTVRSETDVLPPLPSVANNLAELRDVLTDPGLVGMAPDAVHVVADPEQASAMLDPLARLADTVPDVLLVYFAGHGLVGTDGALYLAMPRSTPTSARWSAIRAVDVRDLLRDALAPTRVLVLDCCFSGRATSAMSGDAPALLTGALSLSGMVTIASAPANATALAPPGERLTAFTGEFVASIRAGAPAVDADYLDLATVYRETSRRVLARGAPRPQMLHENEGDRLPLTRNAARSPVRHPVRPAAASASPRPAAVDAPPRPPVAEPGPEVVSTPSPPDATGDDAASLLVRRGDPGPGWTRVVVRGFDGRIQDVALAPDPDLLVAASAQALLWLDLSAARVRRRVDLGGLPWNPVTRIAVTDDGSVLVHAGTSLRRLGPGEATLRAAHARRSRGFAASDDGDLLAVVEAKGPLVLSESAAGRAGERALGVGRVGAVALSPGGGLIAVVASEDGADGEPLLRVLDTGSGQVLWQTAAPGAVDELGRLGSGAGRLTFARHRRLLAFALAPQGEEDRGIVEVREADTGRPVTRARLSASRLAFAGPGSECLLAVTDGDLCRIDLDAGQVTVLERTGSHAGPLGALTVSRDGTTACVASSTSIWLTSWDQPGRA